MRNGLTTWAPIKSPALMLVLAAVCGCQTSKPALPSASAAPAASMPVSRTPTAGTTHERIQQTYTEYWAALVKAGRSDPEQARSLLDPYATGDYLDRMIDGVRQMRDLGREPSGQVTPHVREVWVSGRDAKVIDCQDVSAVGVVDVRTGRAVPQASSNTGTARIEAALRQGKDGRWRITSAQVADEPCAQPS